MWKGKMVLFILIVFIIGSVLSILCFEMAKKAKAVQLAKEYLHQKYIQEMDYLYVRSFGLDPGLFHVFFSPKNKPELIFRVLVRSDLVLNKGWTNSYGNHYEPDNYLLKIFEFETRAFFLERIENICNKDTDLNILVENGALYAFETPVELTENMDYKEMEAFISYDLSISIQRLDIHDDAIFILDMINMIKKSGFKPVKIIFNNKPYDYEKHIEIENWYEIETLSYVYYGDAGVFGTNFEEMR